MTPRPDIGFILHYPLNAAIKGDDVDWQLIPVDLTVGRDLADRLTFLRNATGADAFGNAVEAGVTPVPVVRPPDVAAIEKGKRITMHQPIKTKVVGVTFADAYPAICAELTPGMAGVLVRDANNKHDANAIAVSFLDRHVGHVGREFAAVMAPDIDAGNTWTVEVIDILVTPGAEHQPGIAIRCIPTAWAERRQALLARYGNLTPADLAVFVMPADRSDLDAIEAALDRVESFADVTTAPVALVVTPATEPTPPVDEGADCTADEVAAIGARYNALDTAARSWVTACGAKVRLNPASGGKASVRRRDVLSGLLAYAEGKRDADELVRAALGHILGDTVWQGATVADTLAALTVDEAAQFAGLAALIAITHDAFDFSVPDRTVLTPAVIERAAA